MESRDLKLIEQHISENEVLAALYKEHIDFEKQLEKFDNKPYLTPAEEMERKNLQKLKLKGRDRIENILQEYRHNG